jgi:hypothetical protein
VVVLAPYEIDFADALQRDLGNPLVIRDPELLIIS